MRVGFLADGTEFGGAEVLSRRWIHWLQANGHHVVEVPYPSRTPTSADSVPSLMRAGRWRGLNLLAIPFWLVALVYARRLRARLRTEGLDIILVQQDLGTRIVSALAMRGMTRDASLVLVEHSRLHWWTLHGPCRLLYRWAVISSDAIVLAVADGVRADLVGIGIPPERVFVVANSAQVRGVSPSAGDMPRLVTWSRVIPKKGVDDVIRVVAELRLRNCPTRCLVIGDGPDLPRLTRLADELGVVDLVEFCGFEPDPLSLVECGDVFLTMSRDPGDSIPLRVLEAMGAGLAVVTSAVGAVREVVADGKNGFVVGIGDIQTAAERTLELISDGDLRERLGAAARGSIAQYSFDDAMQVFVAWLEGVAGALGRRNQ